MNDFEHQYLNLLRKVKEKGVYSKNRTGINTYKIWGAQMHIDLQRGFPLLTTKKMHWKSGVHELLWMIKGDTNIQYLLKNGVTFWTEWPFIRYQQEKPKMSGLMMADPMLLTQQEKEFIAGKISNLELGVILKNSIAAKTKLFESEIINNDEFAEKWGSIGDFGYGGLWAKFPYSEYYELPKGVSYIGDRKGYIQKAFNQIEAVIKDLKTNPDSRRIIISAWHPYHSNRKEDALLPACHNYVQFGTEPLSESERLDLWQKTFPLSDGRVPSYLPNFEGKDFHARFDKDNIPKYRLNCYYSMRSNDIFLGSPYNNFFYALFTHLLANQLNMIPGMLVYSGADVHLYENHVEQAKLQLTRTPKELPKLKIKTPGKSIFDITIDDLELVGYNPDAAIKADVAV